MPMAKFEIPLVRNEVEAMGARYRYSLVSREILDAPDWLRARMKLKAGAQVIHLECMHFANHDPFQFEDRWISLDQVPQAVEADFEDLSPNEWLVREVPFSDVEISFSANAVDADWPGSCPCRMVSRSLLVNAPPGSMASRSPLPK